MGGWPARNPFLAQPCSSMPSALVPSCPWDEHLPPRTLLPCAPQIGRRTVTLDTGLRPARLARSEITPECIIGSTRPDTTPRQPGAPARLHVMSCLPVAVAEGSACLPTCRAPAPRQGRQASVSSRSSPAAWRACPVYWCCAGELREGDVVQVFLDSAGTPEGDFLVSGVQARWEGGWLCMCAWGEAVPLLHAWFWFCMCGCRQWRQRVGNLPARGSRTPPVAQPCVRGAAHLAGCRRRCSGAWRRCGMSWRRRRRGGSWSKVRFIVYFSWLCNWKLSLMRRSNCVHLMPTFAVKLLSARRFCSGSCVAIRPRLLAPPLPALLLPVHCSHCSQSRWPAGHPLPAVLPASPAVLTAPAPPLRRPPCPLPPAGRILNNVWGGYAVGVAGLVGFMPAKQCSRPTARRIGMLQKFRILEVSWGGRKLGGRATEMHGGRAQ